MIEVEIKCKPTPEQIAILLKDATFISKEYITDVYYDSSSYQLSLKDYWLRKRNDKFVLKIPATTNPLLAAQANTPKYELETDQEIRTALELSAAETLEQALQEKGYHALYKISKTRIKHTKEGIIIDIDHATFEALSFNLCELELIVEKPENVPAATQRLADFAQQHGITIGNVPGNLIALIQIINPNHYDLLETARAKRLKQNNPQNN